MLDIKRGPTIIQKPFIEENIRRRRNEMPSFGVWEWVVILVIVLVIFGASRLNDIGKGLGGAISEFKKAVQEEPDESADEPKDT